MTPRLYLGGVQLPFVSSLRIYVPREAYTTAEFAAIEALLDADLDAVSADMTELDNSLERVSGTAFRPFPTSEEAKVRVLTMGDEERPLYAPNQVVARSLAGAADLLTGNMEHLATMVLPQEEWAAEIEKASAGAALDMPLQTRSSTWGIPFSWFVAVYANDRMEVVEANGRVLTVRVQVPVATAAGRAERMLRMLATMAPDLDLFAELEDLAHWLGGFHQDGVMELDYGAVANRVHPDDSPADVHMGLQCLADGDFTGAAAAYRRLANRWMPIRQRARAN